MLRMPDKRKPKKTGTHLWLSACVYMRFWPDWNQTRGGQQSEQNQIYKSGWLVPTQVDWNSPPLSAYLRSAEIKATPHCAGTVQQELRQVQDMGLAWRLKVSVSRSHSSTRSLSRREAMSQQLLIGIPARHAWTVEWKDPGELRRDIRRSLNLGIITWTSHRAYDAASQGRKPEFPPKAGKSSYRLLLTRRLLQLH